jgi:hypothetical protein
MVILKKLGRLSEELKVSEIYDKFFSWKMAWRIFQYNAWLE